MSDPDAETLRQAAIVLRRRSRRPRSFWNLVICKVLEGLAEQIEKGP